MIEEFSFDDILLLPGKSDFYIDEDQKINIGSQLTPEIKLEIPIVSSHMISITESELAIEIARLGGIGAIHPFMSKERQLLEVKKVKSQKLKVGATISELKENIVFDHVKRLLGVGLDVLFLDYYHAFCSPVINLLKKIKKKYPQLQVVVGNVVTAEAVEELVRAGADGIKIGIGPGSHCTTRVVTGCGRPQLAVIKECSREAKKYKVPVIADGGIKNSGDLVKALAFGADTVMIGGLLAGCDECPGDVVWKSGRKFKKSWGSCTNYAQTGKWFSKEGMRTKLVALLNFPKKEKQTEEEIFTEGVGGLVGYKGSALKVVTNLVNGLKRGMWYVGARNLDDLHQAKYVKVTSNVLRENQPRI